MLHKKNLALLFASIVISHSAFALSLSQFRPTIIEKVNVQPANGGINPHFSGLQIEGDIMVGTNPCRAEGVVARLEKKAGNSQIKLVAMIDDSAASNRVCTMEYNPQYTTVSSHIVYDSRFVNEVVIKNVDDMGNDVNALDLMRSENISE